MGTQAPPQLMLYGLDGIVMNIRRMISVFYSTFLMPFPIGLAPKRLEQIEDFSIYFKRL
jgi:hypothetical protein